MKDEMLHVLGNSGADIEVITNPSYNLSRFWRTIGNRVIELEIIWKEFESKMFGLRNYVRTQQYKSKLIIESSSVSATMHRVCWYCTNLRELTLGETGFYRHVSIFPLNIWQSLKRTLKKLTIHVYCMEKEIPNIEKSCRRLTTIYFNDSFITEGTLLSSCLLPTENNFKRKNS